MSSWLCSSRSQPSLYLELQKLIGRLPDEHNQLDILYYDDGQSVSTINKIYLYSCVHMCECTGVVHVYEEVHTCVHTLVVVVCVSRGWSCVWMCRLGGAGEVGREAQHAEMWSGHQNISRVPHIQPSTWSLPVLCMCMAITHMCVCFVSEALCVTLHSTCMSSHSLVNDRSVSRLGWDGERR